MYLLRFFLPSTAELLALPLSVLLIIIAYQIANTLNTLLPELDSSGSLISNIREQAGLFSDMLSESSKLAQGVTLFFWAGIGALVYMAVWTITSIVTDFRNQISVSSSYHHPDSFRNSTYWLSFVGKRIYIICSVILTAAYCVFLLQIVIPALIGFMVDDYGFNLDSALHLIGGFLTLLLSLHIVVVMVRFCMQRPRIFSKFSYK